MENESFLAPWLGYAITVSRNGVLISGTSSVVSGVDRCGVASSKAPIYTAEPSSVEGTAAFSGSPTTPQKGPININLLEVIDSLKRGAQRLTADSDGLNLGTKETPVALYAKSSDLSGTEALAFRNITGFGMLLVEGDVKLEGHFYWQGPIVSSGTLTLDGSIGPIQIFGGLWSDRIQHVAGDITINYDSCSIKTALLSRPLRVTNWRQIL